MDSTFVGEAARVAGLDPLLWPLAGMAGIALASARAFVAWFNQPHTLGVSFVAGLGLGALKLTMPQHAHLIEQIGWQGVVLQGLALGVVAFVASFAVGKAAEKMGVKFLTNNALVKGDA